MLKFQLQKNQYLKMVRAVIRRRLLVVAPIIYGILWIVGWTLLAIEGMDIYSNVGAFGLLLVVFIPIAALSASLWIVHFTVRSAKGKFTQNSVNGHWNVQCKLEDGQFMYNIHIPIGKIKRIGKYKEFFTVELNKNIDNCYIVPLNEETQALYNELCEQWTALRKEKK